MKIKFSTLLFLAAGIASAQYIPPSGGGGGTPSAPASSYQYNNAGAFGGSDMLKRDGSTRRNVMPQSNVEYDPITPPAAPSVALAGVAGNIANGQYAWLLTYVTALGESAAGTVSATITVTNSAASGQANLTAIPVSSNALVTSKNVYRNCFANSLPPFGPDVDTTFCLIANIPAAATTYTDNAANPNRSIGVPFDSTAGEIYWGSSKVGKWDSAGLYGSSFSFGAASGALWVYPDATEPWFKVPALHFCCDPNVNNDNIFLGFNAGFAVGNPAGSGFQNIAIGSHAIDNLTDGENNTAVGFDSMFNTTTGNHNVGIGREACSGVTTGSQNVCIGSRSNVSAGTNSNEIAIGYHVIGNGPNTATIAGMVYVGNGVKVASSAVHVEDLPACNAGLEGTILPVDNALTPAYLVTLAGGGAIHCPAYCDGSSWVGM